MSRAQNSQSGFPPWTVPNNKPSVMSRHDMQYVQSRYLPILVQVWKAIESATGHRWRATSFVRDSPSHKLGQALDIAPEWHPSVAGQYSAYRGSDPVLYARPELVRQLRSLEGIRFAPWTDIVCAIENDHIHIQLVKLGTSDGHPFSVYRWQRPKPIYGDTFSRNALATQQMADMQRASRRQQRF